MARSTDNVDWKQKYDTLEGSLQRFKKHAGRIKDSLGVEMKDLEESRIAAEARADKAEEQLRLMEQQLAAVDWKPQQIEGRICDLEEQCSAKDTQIRDLEGQVDEQKQLRQHDARSVEEKASKIKEWVTSKLTELEQQNHELHVRNARLTGEVEELRAMFEALPAQGTQGPSQQDVLDQPTDQPSTSTSNGQPSRSNTREYEENGMRDEDSATDDILHPISEALISQSSYRSLDSRPISDVTNSRPDSDLLSSRPESDITYSSRLPKRPSSSIIDALEIENELFSYGIGSPLGHESPEFSFEDNISDIDVVSDASMSDIDNDALFQELDQNHESTYEMKRSLPPQIKIERKIFPDVHRMDSFVSSTTDSEDMIDKGYGQRLIFEKPVLSVEPMSRSSGYDHIGQSSGFGSLDIDEIPTSPMNSSALTLTPRSPLSPNSPAVSFPAHFPDLVSPPCLQQTSYCYQVQNGSNNVSAIATLPRQRPVNRPAPVHFDYENSVISQLDQPIGSQEDSQVVSAEIHSAPATVTRPSTLPHETAATTSRSRFNTWTTRAYPPVHKHRPKATDITLTEPSSANHLFKDINIPVYATLKGKATLIRNMPFTEESDVSSDDDRASTNDSGESGAELHMPSNPSTSRSSATRPSISLPSTSRPRKDKRKIQQLNHTSSGAVKRGVSHQSSASEVSGDYACPPDETQSDSDTSEPEQKLLKYTENINSHDNLEKCGYLSKLGGKVKTWKKRWFILRNGELFYYKCQHEVLRKPQGSIKLDDQTKISRSNGELAFEITNVKRTYYLTADTHVETDRWVRTLQKVLKRHATSFLLDQVDTKAVIKGFLTKVCNGVTRKCWCVLLGRYFLYYKSPSNKTPFGQIHLRDARLEEIDQACDSDDETNIPTTSLHVLAIWPPYQGPTYLVLPTRQQKDSWLYHLTVAAGGGTGLVGTSYEQLIAKVMEVNADPNSVYWKHPMLLHTKDPVTLPLSTLPSEDLQRKSVELFKVVQQFMLSLIESSSLEVHVGMAQSILGTCMQHPQLQNELFCQLIKQTSRHPVQSRSAVQNLLLCGKHSWALCHATPTSPTNSVMDLTAESKLNPGPYVIVQGWQLLAMAVSLFLPKQSVMWLFKVHLQRNADPRSDIGKYAIFCQRAQERTILKGVREAKPSRMEVLSILLRHPYHHSQPISIPVHFLNNSYQVVSFDGSTTVQEFLYSLNRSLGVHDCSQSGFALFSNDPLVGDTETCLQNHIKVCDVLSKWEETFRQNHSGKLDHSKTIRLLYKNRLYFKTTSRLETDKEKLLLTYQVNEEIISGRFPLNRDLALELATLMAQVEYGDIKSADSSVAQQTSQAVERFYPKKYRGEDESRWLSEKLGEHWASLRGRACQDCVRVYLAVARKWQFCGAKLFLTRLRDSTCPDDIWLAVQEEGVAVLEYSTMQPISMYDFRSVVTFGGWNEDLMVVVSQLIESAPHHYEHRTDKLLFIMKKSKILEVTLLIASYINARLQRGSQEGNVIISV